jgi:hypothetical protein
MTLSLETGAPQHAIVLALRGKRRLLAPEILAVVKVGSAVRIAAGAHPQARIALREREIGGAEQ